MSRWQAGRWIRLNDQMPDHPRVVGLTDAAFRTYVESLCKSGGYLTDGHVARAWIRRRAAANELARAGLFVPTDDGWLIRDYLDYQDSADTVREARKRRARQPRDDRGRFRDPDRDTDGGTEP